MKKQILKEKMMKMENMHIIPFGYAYSLLENKYRPERTELKSISPTFQGKLQDEQSEVCKEAITYLNKYGSLI